MAITKRALAIQAGKQALRDRIATLQSIIRSQTTVPNEVIDGSYQVAVEYKEALGRVGDRFVVNAPGDTVSTGRPEDIERELLMLSKQLYIKPGAAPAAAVRAPRAAEPVQVEIAA